VTKTGGTWDTATIANFRQAFAELRAHPLWGGYQVTAGLLGYKSARGLRWAAGEYHSDGWPGSNRLAWQLREVYAGVFIWTPPCKTLVAVCPLHGVAHVSTCPGETGKHAAAPRARKRYHRPCMDDATYAEWLAFRAQRKETP
jgi:hypothetical protein